MDTKAITETFDSVAERYDSLRRHFIPGFDDYYGSSIDFLASIKRECRFILDLGAGTGLLTKYLFQYYTDAEFTLVDISEKMLGLARQRFMGKKNFRFEVCDYSNEFPTGRYDLIASALSIHHLEYDSKFKLYSNIRSSLDDGGIFINLDQFNAVSPETEEYYNRWWYSYVLSQGLNEKDIDEWQQRRKLDREITIDATRDMITGAGFSSVECFYSFMKFGVIMAIKR